MNTHPSARFSAEIIDLDFSDYAREPRWSFLWWLIPTLAFDAAIVLLVIKAIAP